MSIFDNIINAANNKYASIVSEGNVADVEAYVDTGSMTLNALMSGSIFGGFPVNKVTAFAGEQATGKTFFELNVVKKFLWIIQKGLCCILRVRVLSQHK